MEKLKSKAFLTWEQGVFADCKKKPFSERPDKEVPVEVSARISSGKILDVVTGPGYLLFEIARRALSLEIIGIDIPSAMVKIAGRNAENIGLSERVKFQIGSAAITYISS